MVCIAHYLYYYIYDSIVLFCTSAFSITKHITNRIVGIVLHIDLFPIVLYCFYVAHIDTFLIVLYCCVFQC